MTGITFLLMLLVGGYIFRMKADKAAQPKEDVKKIEKTRKTKNKKKLEFKDSTPTSKPLEALGRWVALIFILLFAGLVGQIAKDVTRDAFSHGAQDAKMTDADLRMIVNQWSKRLPVMLDSDTRADSIVALPGPKLAYYYTLVNYPAGSLSPSAILSVRGPMLKNATCSGTGAYEFIKKGVPIVYHYSGNDGGFVTEVTITPADCANNWEPVSTQPPQPKGIPPGYAVTWTPPEADHQAYINSEKQAIHACSAIFDGSNWEDEGFNVYMDSTETIHVIGTAKARFDFGRCMDKNGFPLSFE
jgi:hypothetical protein